MKIVWLEQANQDLLNAVEWLHARNPAAANRISHLIYLQIKQLQQYPQLGRIGKIDGTRELVVHQTRYIVVYRMNFNNQTIEIIALMHEAMQWPAAF